VVQAKSESDYRGVTVKEEISQLELKRQELESKIQALKLEIQRTEERAEINIANDELEELSKQVRACGEAYLMNPTPENDIVQQGKIKSLQERQRVVLARIDAIKRSK